jgi:hypothetical protein
MNFILPGIGYGGGFAVVIFLILYLRFERQNYIGAFCTAIIMT